MKYFLIPFFAILLAACNPATVGTGHSGFDGTYRSLDGKDTYTLSHDGKIKVKNKIFEKVTTYTIDKDTAEFQFEGGLPRRLKFNADGSAISDSGTMYKKN